MRVWCMVFTTTKHIESHRKMLFSLFVCFFSSSLYFLFVVYSRCVYECNRKKLTQWTPFSCSNRLFYFQSNIFNHECFHFIFNERFLFHFCAVQKWKKYDRSNVTMSTIICQWLCYLYMHVYDVVYSVLYTKRLI